MKVFLSWSGSKSKRVAEILNEWFPLMIQAVKPFFSPDMEKGTRWETEIIEKLRDSKIGISCLTRKNMNEPWVLFEAGALWGAGAQVCPFLVDLASEDIKGPLAQFQHTEFNKEDIRKLMNLINRKLECPLSEKLLNQTFDNNWPHLEKKLQNLLTEKHRYQLIKDEKGKFWFVYLTQDGEIIYTSERKYDTKKDCLNEIKIIRETGSIAQIEDITNENLPSE